MLNTGRLDAASMLLGCRTIVLCPGPALTRCGTGGSSDVGAGRNRIISSGREQKGRSKEGGKGIGQTVGVAAGGRPAAMRHRSRRGLLLGAGRRIALHLL